MNNLIFELQRFAQIYGTDSDDNIVNDRDNVTINALAGNDTVDNMGSTVAVYGGTGNDDLRSHGNYNSLITNVTLDGGDGNDYISNYYANYVLINGGDGDDNVYNPSGEYATINGGSGDDYISNDYRSNNVTINAGADNDHINNGGSNVSINGGDGNDSINNRSYDVTIDGGAGNDEIDSYDSTDVSINGGAGNDNISIKSSTSVTAYGGEGDDTISVYQSNKLYIHGGDGNDLISVIGSNADNINTIAGGEGDDTITGGRGLHLYQYTEGDGNDIITDFKTNDTLQIGDGTGEFERDVSGSDVIITVGNGSVTLAGAASLSNLNIIGILDTSISESNNTITSGGTYKIKKGFSGTITINTTSAVTLDGTDSGNLSNVKILVSSATSDLTINNLNITNGAGNVIKFGTSTSNKLTIKGTNNLNTSSTAVYAEGTVVNIGGGLTVDGDGSLEVLTTGYSGAGIGTDYKVSSSANLTINGGTIIATSRIGAAIGTGYESSMGDIIINGGNITATSEETAIGSGYGGSVKNIHILGGTVNANLNVDDSQGHWDAAGAAIGSGYDGSAENIIIDGGNVIATATGGDGTAIGGATVGNIIINDGTITANANNGGGAGIGGKKIDSIKITGGDVTALSIQAGAAIGSSDGGSVGEIIISGGTVNATNKNLSAYGNENYFAGRAAAIGSGRDCHVGNITINGTANVTATAVCGAAIGSGGSGGVSNSSAGDITIGGNAKVTATTNSYADGAAIGSGEGGPAGNIKICDNAEVIATALGRGAGIGSGYEYATSSDRDTSVGTITITDNAKVTASSKEGAGIGTSVNYCYSDKPIYNDNSVGDIYIGGDATVTATNESNGVGIGAGYAGEGAVSEVGKITLSGKASTLAKSIVTIENGNTSRDVTINDTNYSGRKKLVFADGKVQMIVGTENADEMYGEEGATILALGGNDSISNSRSNVTIDGGDGDDSIYNSGENVSIDGGSGNDSISNSGYNVTIQALGGNDTITNNGSNVLIDAGEDDDSVSIGYWDNKSVESNVTVNLGVGDDYFSNYGFQKISVSGGDGNDYINNALSGVEDITPDNSTLLGGAGDDTIINAGVNTSISGGTGDDYIDNWGNDVIIDSGEGNDYIDNYGDNSFIDGGAGNDYIYSYDEDYSTINGGDGNDTIQGNYWNSSINGGTGNDLISLGSYASNNLIQYTNGDGNDIVRGFNETSTLQIGDGTGEFESVVSGSDIIVTVGDGSVTLTGAAGLSAVNILGKEIVSGPKTLYLDDSDKSPVTLSSDYQHADASARVRKAIKIAGNALDNSIVGGAKNDSLVGKDGNDTLIGGLGNDTFTGGIGNDVFVYIAGNDVVTDYVSGQDTIKFESAITNVSVKSSDVIFTTADGKTTVKDASGQKINYIDVGGNSSVYPDTTDTISVSLNSAKTAAEIFENYNENIFYASDWSTKIKSIDASATTHDLEIFANDTIASKIIGGDGDNILHGSTKNDTFTGGVGNDIFVYSGGNDTITDYTEDEDIIDIESGATYDKASVKGNDVIFTVGKNKITVKDSADKVITFSDGTTYGGGETSVTLTNSDPSPYILGAKIENVDGTKRTKAIEIFGNAQNNSIVSGSKNDSIYGGDGDDTLNGARGNDTLTGGDGYDLFIYSAGKDVITDYNEDEDIIGLAAGTIKTASVKGSDVVFKIGSGTLTVNDAAGKTLSMIDYNGNEFSTVVGGGVDTLKIVTNDDPSPVTLAFEVEVVDATKRTKYDVTIEGNAQNNSIVGGSKHDSIYGAAGDDTLNGGKGNDTLTGGDGNDVFVYTAGKDVITDYETGDKISTGTIKNASAEGSDVVFKIGSGTLTVNDAAGKTLNMIDAKGNEYSMIIGGSEEPPVSLNAAGTAVKIFEGYTADSFDAADYGSKLKTIDASATTHDFEIIGNGLANSIIGGSGDNILIGGLGNDKLWGNEGNDTFIYENGDGKDVIFGFEDGDLLQITGDFSAKFNQSKNEIAFKVGTTSNAITLKEFDATTFNINGDSYQISGTNLVKK